VAAPHEVIADETGLSKKQVKNALVALSDTDIIETRRKHYRGSLMTHIRLDRKVLKANLQAKGEN
jgi:hypothetical protein